MTQDYPHRSAKLAQADTGNKTFSGSAQSALALTRAYYDQPGLWDRDLGAVPTYRQKIDVFRRLIPPEVKSILDVGCGNGAITNVLAREYNVVGLDASSTALAHVKAPTLLGDATAIAAESASFDLALCSEMLEHLGAADLHKAVLEIQRVARRYILLSVPNHEDLQQGLMKCPRCGVIAHVYDHLQSFDLDDLRALHLPGFHAVAWAFCGKMQPPNYPRWLLRIRQERLGVYWRVTEDCFPMCLRCGNKDFSPAHPMADFLGRAITTLAHRMLTFRARRRPDWVVVLYDRSE